MVEVHFGCIRIRNKAWWLSKCKCKGSYVRHDVNRGVWLDRISRAL